MNSKKQILIIDDDHIVRSLFTKIVNRLGANPVVVSSATEAHVILKNGTLFDLIITDLILPSESGWDFIENVRQYKGMEKVPIIIATGASLSPEEMKKLMDNACAVISKGSFDLYKFGELLDNILDEPSN